MAAISNQLPDSLVDNPNIDQWVAFDKGRVNLRTGKVELGQGILTALVQIAADELDVPLDKIDMMATGTADSPDEGHTAGSRSVSNGGVAIRLVCAEVRHIFTQEAAERLGCAPAELSILDGAFHKGDAPTGIDYWTLAERINLNRRATGSAPVKKPEDFRLIGKDVARIDLADKLGRAPFIQDMAEPGMLHAKVLHRPRYDASLADWNEAAALRAGHGQVEFLRDGDVVAVLGDDEWDVFCAYNALVQRATWHGGVELTEKNQEATALLEMEMAPDRVLEFGKPAAEAPAHEIEATYSKPFIAHASIGPSCGVARYDNGVLTVWSHSQGVFPLRNSIAKALKLPKENVVCIHRQGSGCYGHNGADDAGFDAALVAFHRPGRLVRVLWTREDELSISPVGAAMVVKYRAELDADFKPLNWFYDVWSPTHGTRPGMNGGAVHLWTANALADPVIDPPHADVPDGAGGGAIRNGKALYDLPHQKMVQHFVKRGPVRTSSMRGLGAFANVFALESFIDEIAELAGMDPVTYRLSIMADPRARAVIEKAAAMSDWFNEAAVAPGAARGFAFARYKNIAAYCAVVVEVEVEEEVRVTRAWTCCDGGLVVNPDGARNQIDGGVIQAASWALKEQVKIAEGRIVSDRWEHYPILRFSEVPLIETVFIGDPNDPPLGIGEASQGPTGAAIGNAVARALGLRLRHLPMTRERLMAAMLEG